MRLVHHCCNLLTMSVAVMTVQKVLKLPKKIYRALPTRSPPTLESLRPPRSKTTEHVDTYHSAAGARSVLRLVELENHTVRDRSSARCAYLPLITYALARMGSRFAVPT